MFRLVVCQSKVVLKATVLLFGTVAFCVSAKADAIHLVPLCILRISKGCRTKRGFCYCFGLKFAQWLVIAVRSIDSVSRIVFLLLHCIRRVSYRRTVIIVSADKVWVRNCSPPEFLKTTGFAGLYVLLSPQLLCSGSNTGLSCQILQTMVLSRSFLTKTC